MSYQKQPLTYSLAAVEGEGDTCRQIDRGRQKCVCVCVWACSLPPPVVCQTPTYTAAPRCLSLYRQCDPAASLAYAEGRGKQHKSNLFPQIHDLSSSTKQNDSRIKDHLNYELFLEIVFILSQTQANKRNALQNKTLNIPKTLYTTSKKKKKKS